MSRIMTFGFESRGIGGNSTGSFTFEGIQGSATVNATIDTGFFRSGAASLKCTSTVTGGTVYVIVQPLGPLPVSGSIFFRTYMYFDNLPTNATATKVMVITSVGVLISARLTAAGKLQLWNDLANTQIGSDSVATLVAAQWYRIELQWAPGVAGAQVGELKLDGTTVASSSTLNIANQQASSFNAGWFSSPGNSLICHVDDGAINGSTGATQNSYPGVGSIIALLPTSDNARGSWTGGAGGVTNLWDAVNNTPPVGLAIASETNTSQIKDLAVSATDNYDANMTSYTAAGVPTNHPITLVQAVVNQGAAAAASGAVRIVSNPAQGSEDSFSFTATGPSTWATGWGGRWGTATSGDIAFGSRGTAPVMRVGKRTAAATETDICYMAIMVEYDATTVITHLAPQLALVGVGR